MERDVPTGIFLWVGLVGALADLVPEYCHPAENFIPLVSPVEAEKIKSIEQRLYSIFADVGFRLQGVGFENAQRVEAVHPAMYFR
ncbi:MAG: hypothetical protein M3N19_08835 [Candidatus Eremiobacteraeota bacterium]|nr:hypothetical protein [Candidatus Eremiobacteraeota bacterium]